MTPCAMRIRRTMVVSLEIDSRYLGCLLSLRRRPKGEVDVLDVATKEKCARDGKPVLAPWRSWSLPAATAYVVTNAAWSNDMVYQDIWEPKIK